MKDIDNERINALVIDEWIWIAFIILSLLNINGDECEKKYCLKHTQEEKIRAKKIFNFTVLCSFLIYSYLAFKNSKKYNKAKLNNQDTTLVGIRFFASILIVIASSLLLTAQLSDKVPTNPSIQ